MRRLVHPVTAVVMASLIVGMPLPALAEPVLPPGASLTAPRQAVGSAAGRAHETSTAATTARSARTGR